MSQRCARRAQLPGASNLDRMIDPAGAGNRWVHRSSSRYLAGCSIRVGLSARSMGFVRLLRCNIAAAQSMLSEQFAMPWNSNSPITLLMQLSGTR
jgi:hypothetical protein